MVTPKRGFETAISHTHTAAHLQCRHRSVAPAPGSIRIAMDASGSLAIRAWTCPACGDLIEEIQLLSRRRLVQRQSIRFHLDPIREDGLFRPTAGVSAGSRA